ncbi:ABC transporter permease [Opitutus terrae]|uniref:Transport permease protein n=1 Tax=Opitutus terrae (strain DSM 11246 / JCM 15787 / PB90-1) TaxID=452637 RepID=B1ZWT1_OPITP|nr:ABC transporter permease [Opitutus terrae]ACB74208.1 ABC-2 type transporter [Opitutus terrae PB90-1]
MWERILTMLRKEFRSIFRDPRMRMVIFGLPVIQTLIFGYAVTLDVRNVQLVLVDHDQSTASRDFAARFTGSGYFTIVRHTPDLAAASAAIDAARASAILQLNAGFGADLHAGRTAVAQLIVDGSDSNTAQFVLNYAGVIARTFDQEVLLAAAERRTGRTTSVGRVELRPRAWFNADLESRDFYVPGIIATLVMLVGLMLTSMAIVREKEVGTIEQIMVTPIRPVEFILGKCAPFAVIGYINVVMVVLVGLFWFGIPMRGSFLLLLLGTTLFLLSTLGIGLFISTVSGTQQQAMMTTFFFFFPAMLLSGFVYPIANMPEVVQWLTFLDPLRYFLVIIRGIFLKGVGLEILWPQLLGLLVLGVVVLGFAVSRFKKTLA